VAAGVLVVLRASTLALGGIATAPATGWRLQLSAWLLGALAGASAVLFIRAARRAAGRFPRWPFDAVNVWAEAATGAAALLIVATVTPAAARTGAGYWAEPYTVISAVIIAAAATRAWAGAVAAAVLAAVQLLCLLSGVAGAPATGRAAVAIAVGVVLRIALQTSRSGPSEVVVRVIDDGAGGGPRVLSTQVVPLR